MEIALFENNRCRASEAYSGAIGKCLWSKLAVKAAVGELRQYWTYVDKKYILPVGYENESVWHHNWKSLVQNENCEVIYGDNNEHRADIVGNNGTIIEIQKSPIDIRIVRERIAFYSNFSKERIVWLVDASQYWKKSFDIKRNGKFYEVKWKNKRQWTYLIAQNTDAHLFLDFNINSELLLKTWVNKGKILCCFYNKTKFYDNYLSEVGICVDSKNVISKLLSDIKN